MPEYQKRPGNITVRSPRSRARPLHRPGLLLRLLRRLRGRRQLLVRAAGDMPLLLLHYPSDAEAVAREIEAAYSRLLPAERELQARYRELWSALPAIVVVLLEPHNPCGCLGHHHPRGAESRVARRLAAELGHPVAEIDLAYEAIRAWRPEPLSSLAAESIGPAFAAAHFRAALLSVLLHELEHLAFPERRESDVRARSREFYARLMQAWVAELGGSYGMASSPPR